MLLWVGRASHVLFLLLALGLRELLLDLCRLRILHHLLLVGVHDEWRFCPRCAGKLTRADDHLACESCGGRYWPSSFPGAQGILERDGRVLLAQRALEPRKGHWDLPGGFLTEGEDPGEGVKREFLEETGLAVEPVELMRIDIEPYADRFVFSVTWIVTGDGEPRPADDVAALRWFGPGELPEMAFPGQDDVLRVWAARQQHA